MNDPRGEPTAERGLLIRLECKEQRRGKRVLLTCDKLGVSDQGETGEEARRNLQVSLTLFFREFPDQEAIKEILTQRNVEFTRITAEAPLPEIMEEPQFVTEVNVAASSSAAPAREDEIRKVPIAAYLWAHQKQGFGSIRS